MSASPMTGKTRARRAPAADARSQFRRVEVAAGAVPATKGERTRSRLLQAALDVFRKHAFHAARVSDICQAAGISQGAFYIYFRDKDDVAAELMKVLLERLTRHVLETPHFDEPFDAIVESNRRYAEFFNQGGQFNRAMVQILDAIPRIKAMQVSVNQAVAERVSDSMRRRLPATADHPHERMAMAYAMLGMIDSIYLGYFSGESAHLRELFASSDEVVEFASFVWYRTLFGRNPPVRAASRLLRVLDRFNMPAEAAPARSAARKTPKR